MTARVQPLTVSSSGQQRPPTAGGWGCRRRSGSSWRGGRPGAWWSRAAPPSRRWFSPQSPLGAVKQRLKTIKTQHDAESHFFLLIPWTRPVCFVPTRRKRLTRHSKQEKQTELTAWGCHPSSFMAGESGRGRWQQKKKESEKNEEGQSRNDEFCLEIIWLTWRSKRCSHYSVGLETPFLCVFFCCCFFSLFYFFLLWPRKKPN